MEQFYDTSCWKYLHVWRYLSGFSGDVLIRLEQRNTNGEQMVTGSAEEKKWMQISFFLFCLSHEEQGLFPALLSRYNQHTEKAKEGQREVVLWCTMLSNQLAFKGTENQVNLVEKIELPTIFK